MKKQKVLLNPGGKNAEAPIASSIHALMKWHLNASAVPQDDPAAATRTSVEDMVAVLENGEIVSLNEKIKTTTYTLAPVGRSDFMGSALYQRTLLFVLAMAASATLPTARLVVRASLRRLNYCQLRASDGSQITCDAAIASQLKQRMAAIIEAAMPISGTTASYSDLLAKFSSSSAYARSYTNLLLKTRPQSTVHHTECGKFMTLGIETLLPSTGMLKGTSFEIKPHREGLLLRSLQGDEAPQSFSGASTQIWSAIKELGHRNLVHGVGCTGALNAFARVGHAQMESFASEVEALHSQRLASIASMVTKSNSRLVLFVGGPAAFAAHASPGAMLRSQLVSKFCVQLSLLILGGNSTVHLPVPEYVPDAADAHAAKSGYARLNADLQQLFGGQAVTTPSGRRCKLSAGGVVVLTGTCQTTSETRINAAITTAANGVFKVFVEPFLQLNIDDYTVVDGNTVRLLRMLVSQGTSQVGRVLSEWIANADSSEALETDWRRTADVSFNSSMPFELPVLKSYLEPLLLAVPADPKNECYPLSRHLLRLFQFFSPMPLTIVPHYSLLRDFVHA